MGVTDPHVGGPRDGQSSKVSSGNPPAVLIVDEIGGVYRWRDGCYWWVPIGDGRGVALRGGWVKGGPMKVLAEILADPETMWEGLDGFVLETTVWRAAGHDPRVEFLLTSDRLTVTVAVDTAGGDVVYSDSWGKDVTGGDLTSALYADQAAPWVELAAKAADAWVWTRP